MSLAEKIVRNNDMVRIIHAITGAFVAAVLIGWGYTLTQRQLDLPQKEPPSEMTLKMREMEFKTKSTYPGVTLILCGTFVACATILKKYKAKTQWKDNEHPGFTEVES